MVGTIGTPPIFSPNAGGAAIDDAQALLRKRAHLPPGARVAGNDGVALAGRAVQEAAVPEINATDKILGVASGMVDIPNQIAMKGVLPLMLAGGGLKMVGGWLDRKSPETPGRIARFGHTIGAPIRFINQPIAAAGDLLRIRKPVAGVAQWIANKVAVPAEWFTRVTGLDTRRANAHGKQADDYLTSAQNILNEHGDKIETTLKKNPELNRFSHLPEAFKNATTAEQIAHLEPELLAMQNVIKKTHPAKIGEGLSAFADTARGSAWHHERGQHWKEGAGVRNVPKAISGAAVGHAVWNASFVGMDAIAMFGTARSFVDNMHSLKQMYADMTGKQANKVSSARVLLGPVPKPVAEARSQLLKSVGIEGVAQTFSLLFNLKQLIGGHVSPMMQMGTVAGTGLLSSLIGQSVLPFYGALSKAHQRGETIPKEAYAEFIARLNPRFERLGAHNPVTLAVAEKLTQAKSSPADLMKLHSSGQLTKMGDEAVAEFKKSHPAAAHSATPQAHHSHQQLDQKSRPVLGKHTGKLHHEAMITPSIQRT